MVDRSIHCAERSLAAAIALASLSLACNGCQKKQAPPELRSSNAANGAAHAKGSAKAEPTGSGHPALASATPANPLRPEEPSGLTVRNGPGDPSDDPPKVDRLKLPPGFSIGVYTADVPHARSIARGPKGVVFVSTRKDERVYAVVDEDGDHQVDRVHTIAKGLDTPNGIAYQDGDLYIAEISRILRLRGIDKNLADPPEPEVVTDALPDEERHGWRYIRFGPDGLLYMPIGAPCNNCLREEPVFATVSRMKPDGSDLEVFAKGVRNSVGLDWHPETKELWFTENGRDELGNDLPPDELNRAPKAGLHFGYPHCHGGVIVDPEFGEGHTCEQFERPAQNLGPHVAALGMRFYDGKMFPDRYRHAVILAEHGSWNRETKSGYRVMVVPLEKNEPKAYEPFVRGFYDEENDEVWGRPVDVVVLEDGSLLVSDDYKGALYRVTYDR